VLIKDALEVKVDAIASLVVLELVLAQDAQPHTAAAVDIEGPRLPGDARDVRPRFVQDRVQNLYPRNGDRSAQTQMDMLKDSRQ